VGFFGEIHLFAVIFTISLVIELFEILLKETTPTSCSDHLEVKESLE